MSGTAPLRRTQETGGSVSLPPGIHEVHENCDLLGSALASFDLDDLAATVLATCRANVVRSLHGATLAARNQGWSREEVVSAAVALVGSANSLFWKGTHLEISCLCRTCGCWLRISPPRRRTVSRCYCSSSSSNCCNAANRSSTASSSPLSIGCGPGQSLPHFGVMGSASTIH